MAQALSLLTLNCQFGYRANELNSYLTGQLASRRFDFILLQEIDMKVRVILRDLKLHTFGYELLLAHNKEAEQTSSTGIIFRKDFTLCSVNHISFMHHAGYHSHHGAIIGMFASPPERNLPTSKLMVCSAHLHDRERAFARRREIMHLKQVFRQRDPSGSMMEIIGGDFNNMFFKELLFVKKRMMPEFVHCTKYETHSHDTTHLEDTPLHSKFVASLGRIGLRLRTKLDHIFVDADSAKLYDYEVVVQDVLVSDHRPVELLLHRKS